MVIFRKRRRSRSNRREDTTTFGISGRKLFLLWYLRIRARLTYQRRQAPVHLPPPLMFLNLSHLLAALGDRRWLIKQFLHYLPWTWLPSLNPVFLQKGFTMLSIALEKQKDLFLQKMLGKVGGLFSKIKLDGESITAVMDSTSEKMYLCQVPSFWV